MLSSEQSSRSISWQEVHAAPELDDADVLEDIIDIANWYSHPCF